MKKQKEYRGYVFSRAIGGYRVPQHIQNLVIRTHAQKYNLHYLLSGVEHRMNSSYLTLNQLVDESKDIDGLIIYSMFMLPRHKETRYRILNTLIDNGKEIHAAVEDLILKDSVDCCRLDNIFLVDNIVESKENEEIRHGITKFYARNPQ